MKNKIISIGVAPAWDKTIELAGIDWNEHKTVSAQTITPAGKALNINKALSWMGVESTAAGLWGSDDFEEMKNYCRVGFSPRGNSAKINIKLTKVPGRTRENITVVDTVNKRQLHLRNKSDLANAKSMKMLKGDLQKILKKNSLAVFAGAMPNEAVELIELAKKKAGAVIVDSSGPTFKKIVSNGGLFLIKPNVEELGELLGRKIKNEEKEIIAASKKLLTKVKMILVSRGEEGAMLISNEFVISAKYTGKKQDVCNTVACGDYLLAGFLGVIANIPLSFQSTSSRVIARSPNEIWTTKQSQPTEQLFASALSSAIKSATAKAFGLNEKLSWKQTQRKIKVNLF
jgi:fructose-1-phosphate kinase PfkB-like protein